MRILIVLGEPRAMTISMHQASAPRFANTLRNLSVILDKAQAHCEAKKIEPAALTQARLFPDMFPFTRQVQIACDKAKGAVARLAGVEIPKHEDTEQTFAELKARIDKTLKFIESVKPAQIDGSEETRFRHKLRAGELNEREIEIEIADHRRAHAVRGAGPARRLGRHDQSRRHAGQGVRRPHQEAQDDGGREPTRR